MKKSPDFTGLSMLSFRPKATAMAALGILPLAALVRRAGCPSAVGAGMRKNRQEQLPGETLKFLATLGMTRIIQAYQANSIASRRQ